MFHICSCFILKDVLNFTCGAEIVPDLYSYFMGHVGGRFDEGEDTYHVYG